MLIKKNDPFHFTAANENDLKRDLSPDTVGDANKKDSDEAALMDTQPDDAQLEQEPEDDEHMAEEYDDDSSLSADPDNPSAQGISDLSI